MEKRRRRLDPICKNWRRVAYASCAGGICQFLFQAFVITSYQLLFGRHAFMTSKTLETLWFITRSQQETLQCIHFRTGQLAASPYSLANNLLHFKSLLHVATFFNIVILRSVV